MRAISYFQEFIGRDDINIERQKNIDYAKCISIIFMILIHVFTYPEYILLRTSTFGRIIDYYMGGFMSAPIFMAAMGFGLAYSKNQDPNKIIIRGIKLFILAYIVNLTRTLLILIYIFATQMGEPESITAILKLIFEGDILHFAGLALILFGLIKKIKYHNFIFPILALAFSIIVTVVGPYRTDSFAMHLTLGLFYPMGYVTPIIEGELVIKGEIISCFPLLSWFIIVIIGYYFALIVRKVKNLDRFYIWCIIIGLILAVPMVTCEVVFNFGELSRVGTEVDAYAKMLYDIVFTFGFILFDFGLFYFLTKLTSDKLNKLVFRTSNAVNDIYWISWFLILNGPCFFVEYLKEDQIELKLWIYFMIFVVITLLSVIFGILLKEYKTKRKHLKLEEQEIFNKLRHSNDKEF